MDILNELKTFENSNFFIKQPISYVNFYFLYVNNNVLDHIEKECLEIDDKILSDKVINSKLMEYKKNNEKVRFKWLEDDQSNSFFEFRIQFDDITKDVSLIVTDFSDEDEMEESKMLWANQISDLKKILGSS